MKRRRASFTTSAALALFVLAALLPSGASAAQAPAWKFTLTSQPTNFVPGSTRGHELHPARHQRRRRHRRRSDHDQRHPAAGRHAGRSEIHLQRSAKRARLAVRSVVPPPRRSLAPAPARSTPALALVDIPVEVSAPDGSVLENEASIEGGDALPVTASTLTQVAQLAARPLASSKAMRASRPRSSPKTATPATGAGSHPYAALVDLGVPTEKLGGGGASEAVLTGAGHLRDVIIDFPRGLLANPLATPTRCTEVELVSEGFPGCPDSSQVGLVTAPHRPRRAGAQHHRPLQHGAPARGPGGLCLRRARRRRLSPRDRLGAGPTATSAPRATQTTSSPAASARSSTCGPNCGAIPPTPPTTTCAAIASSARTPPCEAQEESTAFLALPGDCPGKPLAYEAEIRSWEEPEVAREAQYESAGLNEGPPTQVAGCNALKFEPQIKAQPTTNLVDSPSGLDFTLHQPQELELTGLYTAAVKDTPGHPAGGDGGKRLPRQWP